MSTAKIIEITSDSQKSYDDAITSGLKEAAKTVENIQSAWVKDHEVRLATDGSRTHRVNMKITFVVNGARA